MAANKYRATVINPAQGTFNPAIVDFSVLVSTPTTAECAAGIMAYIAAVSAAGALGDNCQVTGITRIASGATAGSPVPFPTTEYATLRTATPTLPNLTAYSVALNGGTSFEPLGTSITVSLYTAIPGRARTGRHYLPWTASDVNDGNGRLVATAPGQLEEAYRAFIMGEVTPNYNGVVDLQPVVHSATAGDNLVTDPIVSLNFARLKTRTR